jgi:hypothetical protein
MHNSPSGKNDRPGLQVFRITILRRVYMTVPDQSAHASTTLSQHGRPVLLAALTQGHVLSRLFRSAVRAKATRCNSRQESTCHATMHPRRLPYRRPLTAPPLRGIGNRVVPNAELWLQILFSLTHPFMLLRVQHTLLFAPAVGEQARAKAHHGRQVSHPQDGIVVYSRFSALSHLRHFAVSGTGLCRILIPGCKSSFP